MNLDEFNFDNDLDPEEELKMENKIKRLELELKGTKIVEQNLSDFQIPPEIEAQMLDHILEFEKQKDKAKLIDIFEFLGKPKFKSINMLSSEEIILEKERLLKLMSKKGVFLSSIEEIPDDTMYKFITEEFFFKQTPDIKIKGFVRQFIYEEFYPNERLIAEKTVEFFLNSYLRGYDDIPYDIFCRKELIPYLSNFKTLYSGLELKEYELQSSHILKIKGELIVKVEFEAYIENSNKIHRYEGDLNIEIRKRKGLWQISKLEFPKLGS